MIQCVRISLSLAVAAIMLIPAPAASEAEDLFQAVRNGDLTSLRMNVSSTNIDTRGARGATLLMHAAAFGNVETVRFLIDSGADINAKNDLGATALLWAARDPDKARLLIEHGADVNVQSKQGRTPLMLAAFRDGGSDIVALLLAKGSNVNARDGVGDTALLLAAEIGNIETMRLLIAKGADVHAINRYGDSTLFAAARGHRIEAVRLMIDKGVDPNLATTWFPSVRNGQIAQLKLVALDRAANFGPVEMVRDLLKAGANVNVQDSRGLTPLMFAVSAENQNAEIVRTLIAAGADVKIRSVTGETALDWAEKFGYPEVITALKQAGATHGVEYQAPHGPKGPQPDAATAVTRSIELLQKSSSEYFIRSACVGCHHQPLIAQVLQMARTAGVAVNEATAREQTLQLKAHWASSQDELLQAINPGGGVNTVGAILLGLAAAGVPASPVIDSAVVDLAEAQMADGSWLSSEKQNRPPITESTIASTTRAIGVLRQYPIPARKIEFERRIDHAKGWLEEAKPRSTDDFAMRLLGLFWAGASAAELGQAARDLMALQKQDGGWAGNAYLSSDAFSTGEGLYALHESGMASNEPVYRRGADYLLRTQYPDGSWYVRSRSVKFQPYFESAFPFGHDQWISAAATGWATMALAPCVAERGSNRVAGR
jgi:ankyrin repeat protein